MTVVRRKNNMAKTPAEKYCEILDAGPSPTGLTRIWNVVNNKHGTLAGTISWHGAFRKYVWWAEPGTGYDASFMRFVGDRLDEVNAARRKARLPRCTACGSTNCGDCTGV